MSLVVAGQVWKRPSVYATVVKVYCDADWPDDIVPCRVLVDLVEIGTRGGTITRRTISTDELRADHVLIYDSTLKDPFNVLT